MNNINFKSIKYPNHHNFTRNNIQYILNKSRNYDAIITTEKDWMRLKETKLKNAMSNHIFRLKIEIQFINSEQSNNFKRQINSLIN